MTASNDGQAVLRAVNTMTEEEAAAWIAAGDYSSLGGIPISENDASRIAELIGDPEVAGFTMNPGGFSVGLEPQLKEATITHRKAGRCQQEFLVITLQQVLVS